jgi:hypothetical protein
MFEQLLYYQSNTSNVEAVYMIDWISYRSEETPSSETSVDCSSEVERACSSRKNAATFETFGAVVAGLAGGCFSLSLFCRTHALLLSDLVLLVRRS